MNKFGWVTILVVVLSAHQLASGQDCSYLSKSNSILPDRLCSPVNLNWEVTYTGVSDLAATVKIIYNWDDGSSDTLVATEQAEPNTYKASIDHIYTSQEERCNFMPSATMMVDSQLCESSSQGQVVTVWDVDSQNGGYISADPNLFLICPGYGATMQFSDESRFNCIPPQENDIPNESTRWIQWIYGVNNSMSSATPVSVDGYTGPWPYTGPVIQLPGPLHGSSEISLPVTVADDNLAGEEFEVELRYWNFCNKYTDGADPVIDRSVIRIVDEGDVDFVPVDTLCPDGEPVDLEAVSFQGVWSGPGITDMFEGIFNPELARTGIHTISFTYSTTIGGCTGQDSLSLVVNPPPDADAGPDRSICSGDSIVLSASGGISYLWDKGVMNDIPFSPVTSSDYKVTVVDRFGCVGNDEVTISVNSIPETPTISYISDTLFSDAEKGNQWYVDGLKIHGALDPYIVPIYRGNYTTIVTLDSCSSEESNKIFVHSVGVSQFENGNLTIFPNPTNGLLNIHINHFQKSDQYLIRLYSSHGQLLHTDLLDGVEYTLDLTTFSKGGLLFLTITDILNNNNHSKKIILRQSVK